MHNNYNNSGNNNQYNEWINFGESDFNGQHRKHYTPTPLLEEKRNFSRIGLGYALFAIISFIASLAIVIIVSAVNPDLYRTNLFLNALTPIALYVFALPVLLIVLSKSKPTPPVKQKMSLKKWLLIFVVSFGFMYIGSYVGNYVMDYLSMLMNYDYSNALNTLIDGESLWITVIFTVIVAPIGEEFVFRKLIIDRTQKYGPFVSIGLSALMFALMHGNLYQFFYCFALGIILGYVYYSTGRILLTISLHALINLFGGVITSLLQPTIDGLLKAAENTEALTVFISNNLAGVLALMALSMFMYASMICAVVIPIVFRRRLNIARGTNELPKGRVFDTVFANAGMICLLTAYLLELGLNLLPL